MKSLKSTLLCFALFSTINAYAEWHEVGKVTRVHTGHSTGPIYFTTDTQISVEGCNNVGYTLNADAPNTPRIYALLLAAYLNRTPISIHTTGACVARPLVDAVQFKDPGVGF